MNRRLSNRSDFRLFNRGRNWHPLRRQSPRRRSVSIWFWSNSEQRRWARRRLKALTCCNDWSSKLRPLKWGRLPRELISWRTARISERKFSLDIENTRTCYVTSPTMRPRGKIYILCLRYTSIIHALIDIIVDISFIIHHKTSLAHLILHFLPPYSSWFKDNFGDTFERFLIKES